ncbi:MAG: biopolymer transporter ExbD [candidate division KSB1 bacterium]|nr:biopolymer transporter ExbD [candidate division KSB1 bacterium]MDZ7304553.1 biopolymer transporter ExbD [candidate division KSB1 bacterium]MDZ7313722.1 biopolymer transporter ExbD [candidate division KSB1 bacterium]
MAAIETGESKSRGKKAAKKHKKKRRIGIRIDMTPMVDVAFLLLTFFMLTTVFSKPQTMEINLPPDVKTTVEVAESNLLTLRVAADGTIFWNIGSEPPQKIATIDNIAPLRALLVERNRLNPKLITLVKVDRDGTYKMMVDIMDELNLAEITRFSLAPMTPKDKEQLQKAMM